jgi:hypothetical protein
MALLSQDGPAAAALYLQRVADRKTLDDYFKHAITQVMLLRGAAAAVAVVMLLPTVFIAWHLLPLESLHWLAGAAGIMDNSIGSSSSERLGLTLACLAFTTAGLVLAAVQALFFKVHRPVFCDAVTLVRHLFTPSKLTLHIIEAGFGLLSAELVLRAAGLGSLASLDSTDTCVVLSTCITSVICTLHRLKQVCF